MIQLKDKKDCCGCYACATICPQYCVSMEEDYEGFRYPVIDKQLCNDCGLCESVCPVINRFQNLVLEPKVFACINNNEQIRIESSSGGVFSLLAEHTIRQNGVVFGARFNDDFSVIHDFTETIAGLEVFRGSKYVQSLIGENFKKAENFLKQGREVLFTGTPCQISGLKHYLVKEYKNLLTVDIICHGVPSPKVFRNYLRELNSLHEGRLEKIQFRDKTEGWKKFSFVTVQNFEDKSVLFRQNLDKNIYLRGFLQNLFLRPSCYACPSKGFTSGSDMTIADYWGIQKIQPDFDDDKGCSLVLCNNQKGQQMFDRTANEMKFIETSLDDALLGNACINSSILPNADREKFFKQLSGNSIIRQIKQYTRPTLIITVKQLIYSVLCKSKIITLYNLIRYPIKL